MHKFLYLSCIIDGLSLVFDSLTVIADIFQNPDGSGIEFGVTVGSGGGGVKIGRGRGG